MHCCLDALILWIYTIHYSRFCCSPVVSVGIGHDTMKRKKHLGEQQGDLGVVHLGGQSLGIWVSKPGIWVGIWTFGQAGKVQWDQSDLMRAEGVSSLNSWHPCWLALSLSLSFSFHLNCHCHCEIEIEIVIVIAFVSLPVIVWVLSVEEASWYQASLLKGWVGIWGRQRLIERKKIVTRITYRVLNAHF